MIELSKPVRRSGRSGWHTYYYDKEKNYTVWKKLGNTRDIATLERQRLQKQLNESNIIKEYKDLTLSEYYYNHYKKDFLFEPGTRSWSGKQRMHIERYILPDFGEEHIADITLYDTEAWYKRLLHEKPRKYANHICATFKRMLSRAEGKFLEHSPIARLKLKKQERKTPDTLSRDEIQKLLGNTKNRDFALVALFIHTGLRVGEMNFLQIKDIDLCLGKLFVKSKPGHKIKTYEDRCIELTKECIDVIRPYVEGRRREEYVFGTMDGNVISNFTQTIKRICTRAGVCRGNGLLMRHYFASVFISSGGSLRELQHIMGHSTIQTTERNYAAWIPGLKESIHDIDFGLKSGCTMSNVCT
jgi:integrase/recombinase XerC